MRTQPGLKWMAVGLALSLGLAACKSTSSASNGNEAVPAALAFTQSVSLSGANEVPPVSTSASATGSVTVNANRTVSARIVATGMVATAAHIHMGAPGTNGPVIVPLTKTADNTFIADGTPKLTPEQYAAFKAGNTYVNVHSDAHKAGEIRAQLKGS